MKITETRMDKFHKKLTNEDILAYAKNIGELRKKINEAEYAKNNLKNLYREMSEITGILEKGEVSMYLNATFTYHCPEENLVTITPPEHITDFPAIVRPMTEIEIERHCQHTLEFGEPEEGKITVDDDTAAIMLDQVDNEEYYDPGTFIPENEEDEGKTEKVYQDVLDGMKRSVSLEIRECISKLQIYRNMENREEYYAKIDGKYHEAIINPEHSDDVWKYYIVAGFEKYETKRREDEIVLGFLNKRRNYIRVNTGQQEQKQEVTTTPEYPSVMIHRILQEEIQKQHNKEPEPEQTEKPYKDLPVCKTPDGKYYIETDGSRKDATVIRSLENIIFFEVEGVEDLILKRHTDILEVENYLRWKDATNDTMRI